MLEMPGIITRGMKFLSSKIIKVAIGNEEYVKRS